MRWVLLFVVMSSTAAAEPIEQRVKALVDRYRLNGRGLGWIDVHLIASAMLAAQPLWTIDRALSKAAHSLGIASAA